MHEIINPPELDKLNADNKQKAQVDEACRLNKSIELHILKTDNGFPTVGGVASSARNYAGQPADALWLLDWLVEQGFNYHFTCTGYKRGSKAKFDEYVTSLGEHAAAGLSAGLLDLEVPKYVVNLFKGSKLAGQAGATSMSEAVALAALRAHGREAML